MNAKFVACILLSGLSLLQNAELASAQPVLKETVTTEKLLYHPIHLNSADQTILPWYSPDLGNRMIL